MTKLYLKYHRRVTVLSSLIILCWVGLSARLFQIQVLEGNRYRLQGQRQAQIRETLSPVRGDIYDRDGVTLTSNVIHYSVGVHPRQVPDPGQLARHLDSLTGRPAREYLGKLKSGKPFVYLERNLPSRRLDPGRLENWPGVRLEKTVSRHYPHEHVASQILGFVNIDGVGIAGVEINFDQYLRGRPGWAIKLADGLGNTRETVNFPGQTPVNGAAVQLTIDLEYQTVLQEELARRVRETKAAGATGILMNPQDGAILAMASIPDFNPNTPHLFPPESQKNRAITDQYEPGSTFKIIPTVAALDLQVVTLEQEFNCEYGSIEYAGKRIEDWDEFGLLTIGQIIKHSSNVGIIKVAELVGARNLYRYTRDFGFGSLSNISLVGEIPGTLRPVQEWSELSLGELSFGYEIGITALQQACAYAAVANGGILMKPRLINQIVSVENDPVYRDHPEVIRKIASPVIMKTVSNMLAEAVDSGTGTDARIPGWSVAGKTGTAQKYIDGQYSRTKFTSNFAGYFPAENPCLVGVIILDEPALGYHWGSKGAAPVFKRVVERIINLDDQVLVAARRPSGTETPAPGTAVPEQPPLSPVSLSTRAAVIPPQPAAEAGLCRVPELRGMSLRKALQTLQTSGLRSQVQGSGSVVWQSPVPGQVVPRNSVCVIGLK